MPVRGPSSACASLSAGWLVTEGSYQLVPRTLALLVGTTMNGQADEQFPSLRARRSGTVDQHADRVRRLLWQALRRGELSESQFAQTLERLEPEPAPAVGQEVAAQAQTEIDVDRAPGT